MKAQHIVVLSLFVAVSACVLPASGSGAGGIPAAGGGPISFTASAAPGPIRSGETLTVWVDATPSSDWHIYSATTPPGGPRPTQVYLDPGGPFERVGPVLQPPPLTVHDPNFDTLVEYYAGRVRFGVRARLSDAAPPGPVSLSGGITYMLCSATTCLPPTTHPFEIRVRIAPGEPRPEYVISTGAPGARVPGAASEQFDGVGSIRDVERAVSRGLVALLYLALTMGFIALLTPCVFPMIPITVSFFTKQEDGDRIGSVLRSLVYCAGIILTFTGLGLLLAATLGASGASRFAASPWVNLFITALFVAFALSLFGLFEIRLPPSLLTRVSRTSGGSYGAILLMGFAFTLTSFTCTAPFVGTLLVLTSQGTWAWPIIGMLAFSTAFALPFFFLALFPQTLSRLPRSGGWLTSVKVVMGFLELAAAVKFISNVDLIWGWQILSREVFLSIWVAVFVICGIYILGKIRLPHDTPIESVGPLRLMAGLGCFAFSFYMVTGLFGGPLGELDAFFPPYSNRGAITEFRSGGDKWAWRDDYQEALAEAKATGRPVFLHFTGYTCTNCRWMEANIFPEPKVRSLLDKYVKVHLYTDGQGEVYARNRAFQEVRFGTVALPFYALMSPDNREISRFPGLTRDRDLFVQFLKNGLSPGPGSLPSDRRGEGF